MNEKKELNALTLEETVDLLGAERPHDMGPLQLDPIGMQVLATKVGERLASKRGRPTDQSWDTVRKIPMKETTWDALRRIAQRMRPGACPAAGQIGAIALEIGLQRLLDEHNARGNRAVGRATYTVLCVTEQSREEASVLCPVIAREKLW